MTGSISICSGFAKNKSISDGFCLSPSSGLAATTAIMHLDWNISEDGVKATIDPVNNLLDCSQRIFLPTLLSEKTIRKPMPRGEKVIAVMCTKTLLALIGTELKTATFRVNANITSCFTIFSGFWKVSNPADSFAKRSGRVFA